MNTATMIRSLIDAAQPEEEEPSNATGSTNFGNVKFGAQYKALSFMGVEELAEIESCIQEFVEAAWLLPKRRRREKELTWVVGTER